MGLFNYGDELQSMLSLKAGIKALPVLCDGKVEEIISSIHLDLPASVRVNNRLCCGALPPACRDGKAVSELRIEPPSATVRSRLPNA